MHDGTYIISMAAIPQHQNSLLFYPPAKIHKHPLILAFFLVVYGRFLFSLGSQAVGHKVYDLYDLVSVKPVKAILRKF